MSILSKTTECPAHGHYIGRACPLCPETPLEPAVPAPLEPSRETWHRGAEKELHDWLEAEMHRLGVSYIHGRMDVKSTIRNGWPDFSLFRCGPDGIARVCFVELKNQSGKLSKTQKEVIEEMECRGLPVLVTGDFRAAVEFIKTHLVIIKEPSQKPSTK